MGDGQKTTWHMTNSNRKAVKVDPAERDEDGYTPEMRKIAAQLTNPQGDPYDNARKMGFYCEQCG